MEPNELEMSQTNWHKSGLFGKLALWNRPQDTKMCSLCLFTVWSLSSGSGCSSQQRKGLSLSHSSIHTSISPCDLLKLRHFPQTLWHHHTKRLLRIVTFNLNNPLQAWVCNVLVQHFVIFFAINFWDLSEMNTSWLVANKSKGLTVKLYTFDICGHCRTVKNTTNYFVWTEQND